MRKMKKGSIRCKFDSHKWKESEDGMENICERCGISFADYSKRQRQQYRFRFLAFLRSNMEHLKEELIGPTEEYTKRDVKSDPFYHLTNWTKLKRLIWGLFKCLIFLIGLLSVVSILWRWIAIG